MFSLTLRASAFGLILGLFATVAPGDDKKIDLQVGASAPTFQLRDDRDKTWSSSDFYRKKWVVIY